MLYHFFILPDPFERNLGQFRVIPNEGELFYGIVQDGNDFWNSAFFCAVVSFMLDHAVHTKQITVQQVLDVRRTMELRTAALAALRRTDEEAEAIVGIAKQMRESFSRPEALMELDIGFHEAIARASRNPMFALLVGSFRVVTRQTWSTGWASRPNDETRRESVDGHTIIAAAICRRDAPGAEKAMADHFDMTVMALLNAGVN